MLGDLSLSASVAVFIVSVALITIFGWRLTAIADRLADVTGLGEAVAGGLFLGASTSLAGVVTSVAAAADGRAELSVSNALGGIAAQTAFLALADITYRKSNLEHAAASAANVMQATLLVTILAVPLLAAAAPPFDILGVHPATPVMFWIYVRGIAMVRESHASPMWHPRMTAQTKPDEPAEAKAGGKHLWTLVLRFTFLAGVVGTAGWVLLRAAVNIIVITGLPQTLVGGLFTAVATSLPELVTSLAAVKRGALTLAVGGIIGGNAFDTLFLAASDVAFRRGSIYHAITDEQIFLIALTILMSGILLMGLVRREERGIVNIGFESFAVVVLYVGAFLFVALTS